MKLKLTTKQRMFVDQYMLCRNGAESARRAGYGVLSARITASRLLTKANIQAALAQKEAELARKMDINKATVIGELRAAIDVAQTSSSQGA